VLEGGLWLVVRGDPARSLVEPPPFACRRTSTERPFLAPLLRLEEGPGELHGVTDRDVVTGTARLRDRGGSQLRVLIDARDMIAGIAVVVSTPPRPM
jgi:hypothetical protein